MFYPAVSGRECFAFALGGRPIKKSEGLQTKLCLVEGSTIPNSVCFDQKQLPVLQ